MPEQAPPAATPVPAPLSTLARLAALYRLPWPRRTGSPGRRTDVRGAMRRRAVTTVVALLSVGALALLAYPLGTNVYQHLRQRSLRSQLSSPGLAVSYLKKNVAIGDGLTELVAPAIGLDVVVVEGTTTSALRAGAGHYVGTALPCEPGNVAIAGHRTTYGHPFNRLDELGPGDQIELKTPFADCFYTAVPDADFLPKNPHPVSPSDLDVLSAADTTASTLTLTTCDPKGSAVHRLVLRAALDPSKTTVLHPLLPASGSTS